MAAPLYWIVFLAKNTLIISPRFDVVNRNIKRPTNRSLKLERDWYIVGEGLAPPAPLKELRGKSNGNNVYFELLRLQREQQATPLRQSLAQSYVCASNFVFIACRWAGRWRASAPTVIIYSFVYTLICLSHFKVFWECRGLFYKKVLCIV